MELSPRLDSRGLELCCTLRPSPEMIDYNGHLNMAYYTVLFEEAARSILSRFDLSQAYRERTGNALFASEMHVTYRREVFEAETVTIYLRLLDIAERAIHAAYLMVKESDGQLAASQEVLYLHVNLTTRSVGPMDPSSIAALAALKEQQGLYVLPFQPGGRVEIRRPSTTRIG